MELKEYIEKNFEEILKEIISIINIKSVKKEPLENAPFGEDTKSCLLKTLNLAERLGFKTKNLDNYIGYAEFGEGDEYIAVLGHLDVVSEGKVEGWSVPPYEGVIKDGNLIARGALDNKAPIVSSLYSLKWIVETYPHFNKRVRIIFGTNEESGDEDIKHYLKCEKPPKYAFTPDGRFPVIFSEKGIYTFKFLKEFDKDLTDILKIEAGTRSNIVPDIAKLTLKKRLRGRVEQYIKDESLNRYDMVETSEGVEIICYGKSAHASSPKKGKNAIIVLFKLLDKVLDKNDSLKSFVSFIAEKVGEECDGAGLDIDISDEICGDLTINLGIAEMIDNSLSLKFNIRYPVTSSEKTLDDRLSKIAQLNSVEFKKENHNPPLYFPLDSILVKTLQEVFKEVTNRDDKPSAIGGGTYAKLMPNTVAFGPNFYEFNGNPHGYDEYIPLEMIKLGIEIYAKSILRLSSFV